jgi:hypothetical protein
LKKKGKKTKKKKEKREKLAKKRRREESIVDYCCNPQCFCVWGNSNSPTPFRICCNIILLLSINILLLFTPSVDNKI